MIVIPMDDTDQQLMVTVTERYLIERDLNGCILGRLDLQCLTDMKVCVVDQNSYRTLNRHTYCTNKH